jgi:hypothetical protein
MEMFLMALVLSVLAAGVSAAAFAAATRGVDDPPAQPPAPAAVAGEPRFFADARNVAQRELDTVGMVLQIERHIRLEQAAAEEFVAVPTSASLHSRTASPLAN